MDRRNPSPQSETAQILVEFLQVAITSILFLKGVYPRGAFERRRYMNVVVHKARNPQLSDYIHYAISTLHPFLQKELIERVVVVFYNKEHVPVEKFVFKLSVNQTYCSKVKEDDLKFALRAFLIKLTVSESLTRSLPSGSRWEVTASFRALPDGDNNNSQLWILTETKQWQLPPEITPIKSMISDPLKMQLYLEHPSPSEPKDTSA